MRLQAFFGLSGRAGLPSAVGTDRAVGQGASGTRRRLVGAAAATGLALIGLVTLSTVPARASGLGSDCTLRSLPSFVELADGSVADVIEVQCEAGYLGKTVELEAAEIYARCGHALSWSSPDPYAPASGSSFTVKLDPYGKATVALWGGPRCAAGESLISVDETEAPFRTFTTSFTIEEPRSRTPAVAALPGAQIEESTQGSVATIIDAAFGSGEAGAQVRISNEQLRARCGAAPHLVWVGPGGNLLASETGEVLGVTLDEKGNAFVVALGGGSCAPGASLIEVDLENAPFTTYTSVFTIGSPTPQCLSNSGTVKLTPGLTGKAAVQTAKISGTLTRCIGEPFTEASYTATLTTAGPVSCSVLTGPGEGASGPAKFKWTPKAKPATGTGPLDLVLSEAPSAAFSGEVTAGSFSPLRFSGSAQESYEGAATCGVPNGKKAAKAVKTGTFTAGTTVTFE